MKRTIILNSVLFLLILPVLSVCFAADNDPCYVADRLLVRFTEQGITANADAARQAVVAAAGGGTIEKMYSLVPGLGLIILPQGTDVQSAQTAFASTAGIAYAEPDYLWQIQAIPNDPRFTDLWGMNNTGQTGGTVDADIDAPEAWNLATGSSNVIVAVIDSGVDYTHPDLAANMWTNDAELNGNPGVDDDNNGYIDDIYGYDFANGDGDPMDDHSHGTHCSGTIGGVGNNDIGVAGVNWNVRIMALKFLSASGSGNTADAISAVQYATQMGATLTSNSWGGGAYSQALYDAIEASGQTNQLFVAAAGNESSDNDQNPAYPAGYDLDNIVSVMSTTDTDARSSFSNWGMTSVDLAAPGSAILSTVPGGGYDYKSGTSMACPHVAGAAALVWSADPTLTASEVKQILMLTVDEKSSLGGLSVTGGRLNIASAIEASIFDTLPPMPNPMEWEIEPVAVGLETIYMEAIVATDNSGVEYSFDCLTDDAFDSGWQDSTVYYRGGYAEGTTYQFQVKARDKSDNQNETELSDPGSTTTAAGVDNLPPAPNPADWKAAPRKIGGSGTNVTVAMEAYAALDEIGVDVEYRFEETSGNPGGGFTSGWQDSPVYIASGLSDVAPGFTYSFRVQVRDKSTGQNETAWSTPLAQIQLFPPPQVREVPFPYSTIQFAIDAANNGDTVIVHPGTYGNDPFEEDIDFKGKAITVQSENPEDPAIVASTIIDPSTNGRGTTDRAFIFQSGEGRNSVLEGFTIQNAEAVEPSSRLPLSGVPGTPGIPGVSALGGAIACLNGSSPTIRRCIIKDSVADGSGGDGDPGVPDNDPLLTVLGGNGGNAAVAGGGGIYCDSTSSPLIEYCSITGCSVIANGGNGGDGEAPYDPDNPTAGGIGGNGGNAAANTFGGGIYCDAGSGAVVSNCIISNNTVNQGIAGLGGGAETPGTDGTTGGTAFGGGICHDIGNSVSINDTQVSNNVSDNWGGGLWCAANCTATLTDCQFSNNTAHTDGGAGLGFDAGSTATLTDCAISGNQADSGDGGGLWFNWGSTLTLDGTDVTGNSASSTDAVGGGLFAGNTANPLATTVLLQNNCTVSDNISQFGGGICLVETNLTVEDSVISGNTAIYGGGVYWFSSIADFHDCTIKDNIATGDVSCSGAGLYCLDSSVNVNDVVLTGNVADGFGGAIFFAGPPLVGGSQDVTNCLITENSAAYDGGGISCNFDASPTVANCTIAQNTVLDNYGSGGGVSCYDAFIEITNSILWDNLAVYGPQIGIGDPLELDNPFSTVMLTYSDIQGGEDDVFIGDGWGPWLIPSDTNIDEDPRFAATDSTDLTKNYYLSQIAAGQLVNSPCLNTGLGTPDALDALVGFEGTTRTDHVAEVDSDVNIEDVPEGVDPWDPNVVNMGYHYDASKAQGRKYNLTLEVDRGSLEAADTILRAYNDSGLIQFDVQTYDGPDDTTPYQVTVSVNAGTVASLEAIITDSFYRVKAWHNTDDDTSTELTNVVTMNEDKTVVLECETTIPTLRTFVRESDGTLTQVMEGDGRVLPEGNTLWPEGSVVNLQAFPVNASEVSRWEGTDDDALLGNFNTITMTESKDVIVEFYTPTIYDVTGDFTELQYAIDDAEDGDIIILHPGLYEPVQFDTILIDKNIVIQGYNPDDPETVAATFIQRSQFLLSGTDRRMVINGITIGNVNWFTVDGCDGGETGTICEPVEGGGDGAPIRGGGILFSGNASATIKNCIIRDISITAGNGGDGTQDGNGGWGGWAYGGGVYIDSGDPRFINCQFLDNSAQGGGGGDAGSGGAPGRGGQWDDPLNPYPLWDFGPYLFYWKYSGYGGAVYCAEDSEPEFRNCYFSGNVAYGGHTGLGDRMYPVDGYYKIDRYGGAVYAAERSKVLFTECVFENNQADIEGPLENYKDPARVPMVEEDPYYAYGGTIAFEDDAVITLKDCVFEGGLAHHGGGIYAEHAELKVDDCNFVDNTSSFGGALYYVDTETTVDRTIFSENTADISESQGGAVFAFDSTSVFTDVVLNGNSSGRSGGAIFTTDGTTTVRNGLLINNSAVRDGGGFSSNWYSTVSFQNCTFGMNEVLGGSSGISQGGAVFAGYQSYVDIIDSILWDNSAGQGQQIAISTGFEFDPVPSTVTISYSDVKGNRSASSVFVDEGCTLNWDDTTVLYADPLFVDSVTDNYHLSQPNTGDPLAPLSPCVDAGSDLASVIGLDKYTTAYPVAKYDTGIVDLGYHYPLVEGTEHCAYADLSYAALGYQLDGAVDITDLVILAGFWLENQCDADNHWCQSSDLNFDSSVDLLDFAFMAGCWDVFDYQSPFPNPARWEIPPRPTDDATDSIYMEAVQATDNWIGGVEYYFENQTITDGSHDSGWRQGFDPDRDSLVEFVPEPWIYIDSDLTAGESYTYAVITRDVAGNPTAASTPASAIPGVDNNPPSPDPSEWTVGGEPIQSALDAASMEAVQAVDAEGNGVEYLFVCVEDGVLSSGWQQNVDAGDTGFVAAPWMYEVSGLVLDETYTFYVKTRDRSPAQNETAPSASISVTIVEIDDQPPLPDPAQHASGSPSQFFVVSEGRYYHIVTSVVATDDSDVEYRFVCSNSDYSSGNAGDPDGIVWRNADNVAGLFYPSGAAQVPEQYWANRGVQNAGEGWYIIVRDRSPNQNTAVQSETRTIFTPAP